jgi:hypothetical protein
MPFKLSTLPLTKAWEIKGSAPNYRVRKALDTLRTKLFNGFITFNETEES